MLLQLEDKTMVLNMRDALQRKAELVPEEGFNLVGVDDFGDPDDQGPFLIQHFDEREDAEKEKAAQEKLDPDTTFYIYGPEEAGTIPE